MFTLFLVLFHFVKDVAALSIRGGSGLATGTGAGYTYSKPSRHIFGGDAGWNTSLWEAVDDRVRGGKSQSHLTYLNPKTPSAGVLFSGILDVGTLGNAGFASQQTLHSSDLTWDVSAYPRGLEISTAAVKGDNRTYSLNIYTDEVIPPPPPPLPSRSDRLILTSQPANRSPSTPPTSRINYKYSFTPTHSTDVQTTFAPWEAFKPNYRGREVEGLPPLDVTRHQVTGWSLMCQSFFGTQEKGGFSVEVLAIRVLA